MAPRSWCHLLAVLALFGVQHASGKALPADIAQILDEKSTKMAVEHIETEMANPPEETLEEETDNDVQPEGEKSDLPEVLTKGEISDLNLDLKKYVLEEFDPVPMPIKFENYDVNKNGGITIEELKQVSGTSENLEEAFEATDKDDNGEIDEDEFANAPWRLQPSRSKVEEP